MALGNIVDWVNKEGDSLAFTRLCMRSLPALSPHGVSLRDVATYGEVYRCYFYHFLIRRTVPSIQSLQ